jgi:hypothetical protein
MLCAVDKLCACGVTQEVAHDSRSWPSNHAHANLSCSGVYQQSTAACIEAFLPYLESPSRGLPCGPQAKPTAAHTTHSPCNQYQHVNIVQQLQR